MELRKRDSGITENIDAKLNTKQMKKLHNKTIKTMEELKTSDGVKFSNANELFGEIAENEIYENHIKRIFELMQTEIKPNSKESDELEALSIVVKNYENEFYPMDKQTVSREEIMKALE